MNIYDMDVSKEDVRKRLDEARRNIECMVRTLEASHKATKESKLVFA